MEHGPEHTIEHAEHAQHAAQNPFDRRVTMSIAIVAAILAAITMVGHRTHNETLRLEVETANKWAYFQANKLRGHLYEVNADLVTEMARLQGNKVVGPSPAQKNWREKASGYKKREPKIEAEARKLEHDAHEAHMRADRFDYGELGVEFAVVLCSIAVLTKRAGYWYVGLISCLLGTAFALTGVLGLFMSLGH
jgi:hypothetical protein